MVEKKREAISCPIYGYEVCGACIEKAHKGELKDASLEGTIQHVRCIVCGADLSIQTIFYKDEWVGRFAHYC